MISLDGRRMMLSGPVTLANVAEVLQEGSRHLDAGQRRRLDEGVSVVDLGGVTEMDSALLALLLTWLRNAQQRDRRLEFSNPPASLRTIARLYGVDGLLPVASEAAASH